MRKKDIPLGEKRWKSYLSSYLMILPAIIFLLLFTVYPMIQHYPAQPVQGQRLEAL